ncbi:MAG: metallophosphoesterase family protein [Clostridia bacterium]
MNIFKSIIAVGLASVLALAIPLGASRNSTEDSGLKFNSDGKFKILMIADSQDTDTPQKNTIDLIEAALDSEKPDLVLFSGDNTAGGWSGATEEKTKKAIDHIIAPIEKREIPFAIVFGNHDHEGGVPREKLMAMYQEHKGCLAIVGEEMTGCGTYNLLIKDSKNEKDVFNIWMIDSGDYNPNGGYAYVANDQIAWYEKQSNKLKEANNGKILPSILVQHIAVPEVYQLFKEVDKDTEGAVRGNSCFEDKYFIATDKVTQGAMREGPCSPNENNGQFASWKKQGDILGAFFGHDHVNDYSGVIDDIVLTNCLGAGFFSYGNPHGVRTIELDEKDLTTFKTESKIFEDLVGRKPSNYLISKFGYGMYSKALLTCVALVVFSGIVTTFAVLFKKHRRKKKGGMQK